MHCGRMVLNQNDVLYSGQKGCNDDKIVDMTVKAGCSKLINGQEWEGLCVLVVGHQIMKDSLRCDAKRKQQQEKCCKNPLYVILVFQ
jgi:hypothetical protein